MKRFNPGVTFGDFVVTDEQSGRSRNRKQVQVDYRRGFMVWMIVVVALGVLVVRLVALQVFYGGKYRQLADENRIRRQKLEASRGDIVDRNGVQLAKSMANGEKWKREYATGDETAHVVGYLGEVGEEEVGLLRPNGGKFDVGDQLGRAGVEQLADERLRGVDGGKLIEVDNAGQVVRELGRKNPERGQDVRLTLDSALQLEAYRAIKFHATQSGRGAVVVANPKTGELLALVSSPSYDPNKVSAQFSVLSTQANMPFLNRAVGGIYPPGSTFKMVTTVAAISEGKVSPTFTYQDTGVVTVGAFRYTNWFFTSRGGVEGTIGFKRAIARSTDTFFYKVGEMTGAEVLAKWAHTMGLGDKTGVELSGEVEGLIGTPEWKERVKHEQWFLGNTYHMAIGQGDTLVTPLQVNLMTNVVATGRKCRMHILDAQDTMHKTQECQIVPISEDTLKIVRDGLVAACSAGGTAYPFFEWNERARMKDSMVPVVACKTGTAEFVKANGKTGTHAWLTAYAPAGDPTISVTVLVEAGGEGARTAAPVVRRVMARYFGVEDKFDYVAYAKGGSTGGE